MLKINGLDTYYGESKIIDNLSLEVPKGKIVCLIGRNGVGKSTTLKSIMGLTKTPKGSIMFDGKEIIKMKPYVRAKLGIGYVPQGRDIFPQMTVEENLKLGLQVKGGKGKIPPNVIDLFPIISKFMLRKGGDLSGGQQQRVGIARALANQPDILLMDEPFASLDAMTRNKMQSELLHIKEKEKMTVIFITHNIQEAISLGNKIMVMSKNGTIKEKMDNPISKPVTPASEGYGELWEHLNNALTEENKEK